MRRILPGPIIGGRASADPGGARLRAEQKSEPRSRSFSADQVNEAYERVLASDVRYRFAIDTATLIE